MTIGSNHKLIYRSFDSTTIVEQAIFHQRALRCWHNGLFSNDSAAKWTLDDTGSTLLRYVSLFCLFWYLQIFPVGGEGVLKDDFGLSTCSRRIINETWCYNQGQYWYFLLTYFSLLISVHPISYHRVFIPLICLSCLLHPEHCCSNTEKSFLTLSYSFFLSISIFFVKFGFFFSDCSAEVVLLTKEMQNKYWFLIGKAS